MSWFLNNLYNVVYNTTKLKLQYCKNGTYIDVPSTGGSGTFVSVTAGTGLSGGTITSSGTISMPNIGFSGTYGNSTQYPVITTDAQGRVTNVTLQSIPETGILLNGQSGNSQTFVTGSSGITPNYDSVANVHTLNIPLASTINVTSGTISNVDYESFKNKWGLNGDNISVSNFIGSINNLPLKLRTNNIERLQISENGYVGIGLTPGSLDRLEVNGNIKASSLVKATDAFLAGTSAYYAGFPFNADTASNAFIRLSTSSAPSGSNTTGRAGAFYIVAGSGWRMGTNMGLRGTYDFDIDEILGGVFSTVFTIKKTTQNFGFSVTSPTEKVDISGNVKYSGTLKPAGVQGTVGQVLTSQGVGLPDIWATPSGGGGSLETPVDNEIPSGAMNSVNNTFSLVNTPIAGSVHLYLRGLRQTPGVDYTISGPTIIMINIPDSGDSFLTDYRY